MDITQSLTEYFRKQFPNKQDITVEIKKKITSGWETDIYFFTVNSKNSKLLSHDHLVLRIFPNFNLKERVRKEFEIIRWLKSMKFQVPEVLILESEENPIQKPFIIMEEIKGETLAVKMKNNSDKEIQEKVQMMIKILDQLHNLDLSTFPFRSLHLSEIIPINLLEGYVSRIESTLKNLNQEFLIPLIDWIKEKSKYIEIERLSIVHGDFHPDNIIINASGNPFVLDWSAATLTDYRNDFAWTLLLSKLYQTEELIDLENFSQSIVNIDFFMVIAILRRLSDFFSIFSGIQESSLIMEEKGIVIQNEKEYLVKLKDFAKDYTGISLNIHN